MQSHGIYARRPIRFDTLSGFVVKTIIPVLLLIYAGYHFGMAFWMLFALFGGLAAALVDRINVINSADADYSLDATRETVVDGGTFHQSRPLTDASARQIVHDGGSYRNKPCINK